MKSTGEGVSLVQIGAGLPPRRGTNPKGVPESTEVQT